MPTVHPPLVYYAMRDGLIKIGTTNRIRKRLSDQGVDELLAVEPGSFDLETERHAQFAEHKLSSRRGTGQGRGRGPAEWFRPGDDLMAHIEALRAVHPLPELRSRAEARADGGHATGSQDYNNLHHRMVRARGKASLQQCVRCGELAKHWAQLHETNGLDIWADYVPMCIKCHRTYDLAGVPKSAEHRAQLSEYARNRRTPEHLQKISDALKGRPDIGMAGKHHSAETRRKIREAQPTLGKKVGPRSPEIRQQISETMRSPEYRERRRQAKLGRISGQQESGDTLF
jgi:hypothetical protein